ncbi:hypothetical protein MRX96_052738 [Rhipicephalus microplus]
MGLLSEGSPLSWPETKEISESRPRARRHAVHQPVSAPERPRE